MRRTLLLSFLLSSFFAIAQMPGGRVPGSMGGQNMNVGHFYGKVVNSKTGRGIDGASLQLLGMRMDTVKKQRTEYTVKAGISAANGDFSFDGLPVMGTYTLRVSTIGFKLLEQKVSFNLKMPTPGQEGGAQAMIGMIDKDLGNIKLEEDVASLGTVTVTTTARLFEMGVDRKVFNVDKNLTSQGQTAVEVMKSIPSLSVDIEGNVTMRNAAPQLFVDGRPTTLTMDQIPADLIEKVELITNPSASFDASGGNAGILNIVLKKNRKSGYNGGVRAGVDSRGKVNVGGDLNLRQNKVNFFLNALYNQRKSKSWNTNDRTNLIVPPSRILQEGTGISDGYFAFVRGGMDYFIDNRNTVSIAANFNRCKFGNESDQFIDSIVNSMPKSQNVVDQNSESIFRNVGSQLSFKHNFAKNGHEWTADGNYNSSKNDNTNFINTRTFSNTPRLVRQQSLGGGNSRNIVIQTDYKNPITENQKIEFGARTSIRDFENNNLQAFYSDSAQKYLVSQNISSRYKFTDNIYAGYATYSFKIKDWSYQLGLRGESSNYGGDLTKEVKGRDTVENFVVKFPISLFPSAFITYKLSDKEDIQLNYSRRINRPNFFQLMPFIDYSDPQNISVGNAGLKPEFTNSLEISYNNSYKRNANFLASAFFKHNTNLITRYQYLDRNPDTAGFYSTYDSVIFNTYLNANNSFTYGLELT
ncbi:MAG: TonB-dependent receptor, partial [Segetibacter sp.]|nr:TonB-dependent receptor [Segetibacter sp.]